MEVVLLRFGGAPVSLNKPGITPLNFFRAHGPRTRFPSTLTNRFQRIVRKSNFVAFCEREEHHPEEVCPKSAVLQYVWRCPSTCLAISIGSLPPAHPLPSP